MSWREMLGAEDSELPVSQNPQNTHNAPTNNHSAYSAHSAEQESKLLEVLSSVCHGLIVNPREVRDALSIEDVEDWCNGGISATTLLDFSQLLAQRKEIQQGQVPAHFTKQAVCLVCGPIWFDAVKVLTTCPWCYNRLSNRPIPRPIDVRCADCNHFKRIEHPRLGHCAKGLPEPIVGLWDGDRRHCEWYLPVKKSDD
jgi:hypothetical protein